MKDTRARCRFFLAVAFVPGLLAACSGSSTVSLCDKAAEVREAIAAGDLDDPAALDAIATAMRTIEGDEQLEADLELLASAVEVRALAARQPVDEDDVAALDAAVAALEARVGDLVTAQTRVRDAVDDCAVG